MSRANIDRNRLTGAPGGLPALLVEHEGRTYQGNRVECPGPVVFVQDDTQTPSVWAETDWPVVVSYG